MIIIIVIVAIAIVVLYLVSAYNQLVAVKNEVDNANGAIDTMLKKRHDLIPNLVETVKQYMNYEQSTLTKITELRSQAISTNLHTNEKLEADEKISSLMGKIIYSAENYPILQANVNFIQLQESWNDVEENISAARRAYNFAVMEYNNAFESFPGSMLADRFHYQAKKPFEAQPEERENLDAKALFGS